MTFLPIVERELRVRSRQWPTYWVRVIVGIFGILLCAQQLTVGEVMGGPSSSGRFAFRGLVIISFIICCFGCLVTADAISLERREETLGLLFLTRIRAGDILLGKLAAAALLMVCALIAFLPVMMLPVLAGGVDGVEAFQSGLMLLNTLFLALAVGLLASARNVDWLTSAKASAGWMVAFLFVPPVVERLLFPRYTVGLLSPFWGMTIADGARPVEFLVSMAVIQLAAWWLLYKAVKAMRGGVMDASADPPRLNHKRVTLPATRTGSSQEFRPVAIRSFHRIVEPIGWLLGRQRGIREIVWTAAAISVLFGGARFFLPAVGWFPTSVWFAFWPVSFAGVVLSGVLFAWASTRFFFEARRSGELELLLTTPVGSKTIVGQQWLFLRRMLRWPFVLMLLPMLPHVQAIFSTPGPQLQWIAAQSTGFCLSIVNTGLSLVAICWVGMWFGLKSRTQGIAVFQTVALVKGLPYLFWFSWTLIVRGLIGFVIVSPFGPNYLTGYLVSSAPQILILVFQVWVIVRTRRKMLAELCAAEALPFFWSANSPHGQRTLMELVRRARHWTPS